MAYSQVVKLLAVNRLIRPGAEFYVHHHWFSQTAMDVLLDCDFAVAEKNRLYRCLDRILPYKEARCSYLKETWQMMFNLEYNILLYDRTLLLQRYTEPQEDQKRLLYRLGLELPPQKPPKIHHGQIKK